MDIRINEATPAFFSLGAGSASTSSETSGVPFSDLLEESMKNLQETRRISDQDAYDLAMGRADDLATIAIHSAQASTALELTVQIASRAVSAYKEILQMQV